MPFMQSNSGADGDFKVYASFNSKAGRWYTREDKQDAQQFEVADLTAVFDMDNLRTGFFMFAAGAAPIKVFDPSLTQMAPNPGEGYKRGFQLDLYSEKNLLGVREFASTAGVVIDSMNKLFDAWEAGKGANAGKLPVVKCVGVTPVTNKHGTNYQPQFEIKAWVDRPAGFGSVTASTPAAPKAPPAHVPAPTAKAPAPVMAEDEVDF